MGENREEKVLGRAASEASTLRSCLIENPSSHIRRNHIDLNLIAQPEPEPNSPTVVDQPHGGLTHLPQFVVQFRQDQPWEHYYSPLKTDLSNKKCGCEQINKSENVLLKNHQLYWIDPFKK